MKRPRNSGSDSVNQSTNLINNAHTLQQKEYRFVHYTTTGANGDHKYVTLMLFHKVEHTLDNGVNNTNPLDGPFESAAKTRTFFKTSNMNVVPIAVCLISWKPFFCIHKQLCALLYESITQNGPRNGDNYPSIDFANLTIDQVEEYYSIEFLISLF
jgi:hypothetical protein